MTAPWPSASFLGGALALLALFMFGGNAYVVRQLFPGRSTRPHWGDVVLITGLLLTAVFLWLSLVYAALSPTSGAWIAVFLALNSMMVAVSAWFVAVMLRAEERPVSRTGGAWPATFAALIVANELSMAVAFVLLQIGPNAYWAPGGAGTLGLLTDASTSVWFFWPMLGTMALLLVTVPLPRGERRALWGLTASAAIGPWVVAAPLVGAIAMALLMTVVFVILFAEIAREPTAGFLGVARGVIVAYALMAGAEAAFFFDPSAAGASVPFAAVTLLVMGAEVLYLGRRALVQWPDAEPTPETAPPAVPAPSPLSETPPTAG